MKFVVTHGNYGNDIRVTGVTFKSHIYKHTQECILNNNFNPSFLKTMINQNSSSCKDASDKKTPTKKSKKKDPSSSSSTSSGSSSSSSSRSENKSEKPIDRADTMFGRQSYEICGIPRQPRILLKASRQPMNDLCDQQTSNMGPNTIIIPDSVSNFCANFAFANHLMRYVGFGAPHHNTRISGTK